MQCVNDLCYSVFNVELHPGILSRLQMITRRMSHGYLRFVLVVISVQCCHAYSNFQRRQKFSVSGTGRFILAYCGGGRPRFAPNHGASRTNDMFSASPVKITNRMWSPALLLACVSFLWLRSCSDGRFFRLRQCDGDHAAWRDGRPRN